MQKARTAEDIISRFVCGTLNRSQAENALVNAGFAPASANTILEIDFDKLFAVMVRTSEAAS